MTDFLDMLGSMLTGRPVLQQQSASPFSTPDNGSAPSSAPPSQPAASMQPPVSSPTAQVLARLKTPSGQGTAGAGASSSYSNPLGLTTPIGGNDLGIALSGLKDVNPHASRFGALAQGFAAGMSARSNAAYQNEQLGIQERSSGLEAMKNLLAIQAMQDKRNGTADAYNIIAGGAAPSPNGGSPAPLVPAPAAMPRAAGGSSPASPAASASPVAPTGSADPTAPNAAPAPGPASPIPTPAVAATGAQPAGQPALPSYFSPPTVIARIQRLSDAGDAALRGGNQDLATTLYGRANQEQTRLQSMLQGGKAFDANGREIAIPGAVDVEGQLAHAKALQEGLAKNETAPAVTEDGTKYVGGAPMPPSAAPTAPTINRTPMAAQVDPDTATVSTSIPSAPRGGGFPVFNLPPGAKPVEVGEGAKEIMKADAGFSDIVGKAPTVDAAIQRYQSAAQALKSFQSGAGTESLQAGAALAQSFGYSDVAQRILGGDPAAVQWLKKEGVGLTLDTLKAAQPRFAQAEFTKVSDQGVPSPDNLPLANHQLISEGLGSLMRSKAFIQDWQAAQQQGWKSPSAFYTSWSSANPLSAFTGAAQRQLGTFKGMDLPPAKDWTTGATYVAPKNMSDTQAAAFAKRGIQPGAMFRFNGRNAPQPLQPIPPSEAFRLGGAQ